MTNHDARPLDDQDTDAADPTRQKLESLFQLLRGSDGPNPGDANSVSQRFRLLRRHARGGLGDIWIAHDEELDREVALKEIQPQFAGHEQSWSRFQREATITGQLEHPGIVPIHALGHHENGQPFYAMRFVQGDSLADAIARFHAQASDSSERNLRLRKLVTRLIDVCNAVAYAHSRGVLHRDLKPSNIMLGEFGETLVVDWGLAKPMADVGDETQPPAANVAESVRDSDDPSCGATRLRETPPTQIGSAIGSPPYMSPEQAAGRLDQLGPATDIYSLGATLFELLTGQAPIGAAPAGEPRETLSIKDLLQRIQEGRFPRPSSIAPGVPRALEAVCLKAMSLHPADRYASARDLAADLEAWLADEPVTAWTEPLTIRARRWMRRHQTAVVSTIATSFVVAVALAVLAAVISDRNDQLATAKSNLERSNTELTDANTKVKAEAENARRSAEDAAAVLQFFQGTVLAAARPEGQAGGLGVNATIRAAVDAAEPQVSSLFRDRPLIEAAIRNTLGLTYSYVGEANLAIAQIKRSCELRSEQLGADDPVTLAGQSNLALVYLDAGKIETALSLGKQTIEMMQSRIGSDDPITLNAMNNLAQAYQTSKQFQLAVSLYEQTLEKQRKLLGSDHPQTLITLSNLADTYHAIGDINQAIRLHEETLQQRRVKLGEDAPDTLISMNGLACAYAANGQHDLAIELHVKTTDKMRRKFGSDHVLTLRSAHNLAQAYRETGELKLAMLLYEQTLQRRKAKLGTEHADTLATMRGLARTYEDAGKFDLALPLYKVTLEFMKKKTGADDPGTLNWMNHVAYAYHAAKQFDNSVQLYELTLEKQKQIIGPDHPDTVLTMRGLALAYRDAGKLTLALPLHEQLVELTRKDAGADHSRTLGSIYNLAYAYQLAGKPDKAEPLYQEALAGYRSTLGIAAAPTQTCIAALIDFYSTLPKPEKAEPLLRELVEFAKTKFGIASPNYVGLLASLSLNLLEQKKFTDAEPLLRECQSIREKKQPDDWRTHNTKSMLGGSLLGQKKYAEAEPLLLAGYEGMKQHEADIPAQGKIRLTEAIQRLVDLYDSTDQKDKADEWRRKLPEPPKTREESNQ